MPIANEMQSLGEAFIYLLLLRHAIGQIAHPTPTVGRTGTGGFDEQNPICVEAREKLAARLAVPGTRLTLTTEVRKDLDGEHEDLSGCADGIGEH